MISNGLEGSSATVNRPSVSADTLVRGHFRPRILWIRSDTLGPFGYFDPRQTYLARPCSFVSKTVNERKNVYKAFRIDGQTDRQTYGQNYLHVAHWPNLVLKLEIENKK